LQIHISIYHRYQQIKRYELALADTFTVNQAQYQVDPASPTMGRDGPWRKIIGALLHAPRNITGTHSNYAIFPFCPSVKVIRIA